MFINISANIKKSKEETQFIIENKNSQVESIISNSQENCSLAEIKKTEFENKNKLKFKNKDYIIVNKEKINTTFIDDGRLDKTFDKIEKIGQGGFGCVFKACHKIDGSYYAIKMIQLKVGISENLIQHKVIKEARTMINFNHKNIVRYTTCWFQLNIDYVRDLIVVNESSMSLFSQETSTIRNISGTKSLSGYNYYPRRSTRLNIANTNINSKTYLDKILENEEKVSIKSKINSNSEIKNQTKFHFNWDESLTLEKKNEYVVFVQDKNDSSRMIDDTLENDNVDKALSVSIENIQNSMNKDCEDENINSKSRQNIDQTHSCGLDDNSKTNKNEHMYYVYFFMQMEFCDGVALNEFIENNKYNGLERSLIFNFFKQIVNAVNHIHKAKVVHRDLK
jgi:serine/threonine protein kinase